MRKGLFAIAVVVLSLSGCAGTSATAICEAAGGEYAEETCTRSSPGLLGPGGHESQPPPITSSSQAMSEFTKGLATGAPDEPEPPKQ